MYKFLCVCIRNNECHDMMSILRYFHLQIQSDKYRKLYEDAKQKCEGLEAQLVSLRKVCLF
jgi:hypothetical protein